MAWGDWLVAQRTGNVDIPTNLLKLISQVEHAPGMDYAAAIAQVAEYFVSGRTAHGAEVDAAIAQAALQPADVENEWKALWNKAQQALPKQLQVFATTLDAMDGKVSYPLVAASQGGAVGGAALPVTWSVSESAQFELEAMSAAGLVAAGIDVPLGSNEVALRIGVGGVFSATAAGQSVPHWGSIAVAAGASVTPELDLYVKQPASRVLLDALLHASNVALLPGDLASALNAARDAQFGELRFGINGSIYVSGTITAGYSASAARRGLTPGGPEISVQAVLGARLGAKLQSDGAFVVTIASAGDSVRLTVEQDRKGTASATVELGANVSVHGLAETLDPFIAQWLPDDAALLAKIEQFADLKAVLASEIGKVKWLQSQPIAAALVQVLVGNASAADVSAKAEAWLADAVTQAIHGALPWLTAPPDEIAAMAAKAFSQRFGIRDAAVGAALIKLLTPAIESAQGAAGAKLEQALAKLKQSVGQGFETLLQPLAHVGANVSALLKEAQGSLNVLVAPVRQWLDAYTAFRKRIMDAVNRAAEGQIGLKLLSEYSKSRSTAKLFSATLVQATPTADALYRAALMGRFDDLPRLCEQGVAEKSIVDWSGIVTSTFDTKASRAIDFQLFGLSLLSNTTAYSQAYIESDFAGRVLTVLGTVNVTSVTSWWHEIYAARLGISVDLLKNAAHEGDVPLAANFSIKDEKLLPKELDEFVTGLTRFGMLNPAAGQHLYERLAVSGSRLPSYLANVQLGVSLQLSNAEFRQLTLCDPQAVFDTAATLLYGLMRIDLDRDGQIQQVLARYRDKYGAAPLLKMLRDIADRYVSGADLHDDVVVTGGSGLGALHPAANAIVYVAKQAAGIADAVKDLHQAATTATSGASATVIGTTVDSLLSRAASSLERSTRASMTLFPSAEQIPWSTLGFYMTLGRLVNREPPYGLAINATVPGAAGEPDRALLIA